MTGPRALAQILKDVLEHVSFHHMPSEPKHDMHTKQRNRKRNSGGLQLIAPRSQRKLTLQRREAPDAKATELELHPVCFTYIWDL